MGTQSRGVIQYDPETGSIIQFRFDPEDEGSLSFDRINILHEDVGGTLWIGTDGGGLNRFDQETHTFSRFRDERIHFTVILNIHEDSKGRFWIGTYNGGLHLFDRRTGLREVITEVDGLPHNAIKGIQEDGMGALWIGTQRGLVRFEPELHQFTHYSTADGLQDNHFNYMASCKGRNGRMYFGGANGFNLFYPQLIKDNPNSPPVVLTDCNVYDANLGEFLPATLANPINVAKELRLTYKQNDLTIGCAALCFSQPEKTTYAYRMVNDHPEWRTAGNLSQVSYTNLNPGTYRFEVKAANGDGFWSISPAALSIIIAPPFWQTIWFRILAAMIIAWVIYQVYRIQIRKIQQKRMVLEERVRIKTEAAAALEEAYTEVEQLRNRLQAENVYLQDELKITHNFENILTQDTQFKKVLISVEQVAETDTAVLILGESGTGKELLARAVHSIGKRSHRPLVKLNCAALPAGLIESELFGHEKGAFTGAVNRQTGRFELADGGSIFLDEVGEIPLELQPKLLRVLQEGEFERLGGSMTIHTDVRVIAATNCDLHQEVQAGNFREDLYYRLNVFPISIPPLRQRRDDIPLLVRHFLQHFSQLTGKEVTEISRDFMDTLQNYSWPGNVRELENIIERAVIVSPGPRLLLGDWFSADHTAGEPVMTLMDVEKQHIQRILEMTNWRVSGDKGAAKILQINSKTLESRMKKLGIRKPR